MSSTSASESQNLPLVASYCVPFLNPEMLHVYRQVTALRKFRTVVLTEDRRCEERYPFEPVEILRKPRINPLQRLWLKYGRRECPLVYRGHLGQIIGVLDKWRPVLLHIYFGHTGAHLLEVVRRWNGPSVISFHGMDVMPRREDPGYLPRLKAVLQEVPLVLARSHSLAARLLEIGCPEEKIRINRTGIPLAHYPETERRAPEDGAWHVVQACRLIPKKGLPTTLLAFARFREKFPRARLTIAGEGPMRDELEAKAARLGLERDDAVRFTGFLTQGELRNLYNSAHLFLHPSEMPPDANQEGVPNSMLEAMSTGLPVVATTHGGIPEAVTDGLTGLLLPERDADGLAAALCQLAGQPSQWAGMGRAAARFVHENFEHQAAVARLEAHYEEAIARGRSRPA